MKGISRYESVSWMAVLAVIFTLFSESANTYQNPTITIYTEHFPPYNFREEGQIKGINHDIIKHACEQAGLKCTFKMYPWQRAMALALSKRFAGLVSTSRLPEREAHFQWVGPLVSSPACFYSLSHRDDIEIASKQQLRNYSVGLHKGDVYERVLQRWGLEENVNYVVYSEKFGEIEAFKKGKLDLIIASANSMQYHVDSNRLSQQEVKPVFEIRDKSLYGNYLAVNLAMPKEIVIKLQDAVTNLIHRNMVEQIKKRYIPKAHYAISESESSLEKRCLYR